MDHAEQEKVRGFVVNEASGDGVAGALIELWNFVDHAPSFVATTVSDSTGSFQFDPDPAPDAEPSHGYEFRVLTSRGDVVHAEHHVLDEPPGAHPIELRIPANPALPPEDEGFLPSIGRALEHAGLPTAPEELIDVPVAELRLALSRAIEDGILGAELRPELDSMLEVLRAEVAEAAMQAGPSALAASRGSVLAGLGLDPDQLRKVLASYQARAPAGSSADAWTEDEDDLDEAVAEEVAACLELTEVVGNDARLIRHLHEARRQGTWSSVDDLTALDLEDWCGLVEASYAEDRAEDDPELEGEFERHVKARANAILEQFEASYPSPYIERQLLESEHVGESTRELLARAEGHDFTTESIRERVSQEAPLASGLAPEAVERAISEIEGVERLSRLECSAEEVVTLVGSGLDSAQGIAALDRRTFIDSYGESLGGRPQAARIHAQAQLAASANQLAALALVEARQPAPFVMGGAVPDDLRPTPDFRQIFGAGASCDCAHCGSVYSPAAYFVDLLRYLGDRERLDGAVKNLSAKTRAAAADRLRHKPLDLLLARRPDLSAIPLTCENTLTPLPYIDLVNEILEAKVTGEPWNPDSGKTPADVLRAVPQNLNRAAYRILEEAVFPLSLPFHEPLETFRAYLGHLGVSRHALLSAFARTEPDREGLLAESLKMSRKELAVVLEPLGELWRHWGFVAAVSDAELVERLAPAPAFMKASELSFAELVELARMRFLTRGGPVTLVTPAVDCDPARVRVEGLGRDGFERVVKVVRLKRRLEWSFTELDRVLAALGSSALDLSTLEKLVCVRELSRRLSLPPTDLLVLWAPLDTFGKDSAYARLLETRAVAWQAAQNPFRLTEDQRELLAPSDDLTPVAPALLAAFRVTHEELTVAMRLSARRGEPVRLDLASLSALYRVVLLSRATELGVKQLDGLLRLAPPGADPFTPREPAATLRFVELAKQVSDSPFSPELLAYLFLHESEGRLDPAPKRAQIDAVLSSVRRGLVDAFVETSQPGEIAFDTLRQKLALLLDAALLDAALEALDPRSRVPHAKRREFFDRHLARIFADPEAAAAHLFDVGPPARSKEQWAQANASLVLEYLLPVVRTKQLRGAIVQAISDSIGLSNASTGRLLEQVLRSQRVNGKPILEDFSALLGTGLTGAYFDNPDLAGTPALTRLEPEIAFGWSGSRPADAIPASRFSVRYTGRIHPKAKGAHTFYVASDGAVRLSLVIDGEERVLIERASAAPGNVESSSDPILLDSSTLYEIRLEYRNRGAAANLSLAFGTNPASKQVVPTTHLYPSDGLASFAPVEESYRRIHKAALLLTSFGATDAHLEWLSGETRPIDLDALPMRPGEDARAKELFDRWRKVAALYAFRKSLPPAPLDVFEVFRAKDAQEALQRLLQATGWDAGSVSEILGPTGLRAVSNSGAPPTEQSLLLRLARAVELQRRVGVSATTLFSWASRTPDEAMAAEAVQAVKARYDERRWLEVAKALNDPLRLARRDALVAYLLPRLESKGVLNRNQLFEYFLIDVDMSPCMLTSRIRQAIGSVQTYYQRCLMGLELAHPRLIDENAWRWTKNYRVWEANRKIFLYPENWIEPELRDDKSPLFLAFERALLQDEIKKENVEAAFTDYLQGLDEIARLDVRAVCFEPDTGRLRTTRRRNADAPWTGGVHHVFARTFGGPHVWYYRRFEAGLWTPWEKVEADIDGEHLVPVIFHGRLHLFWAVFREVGKKPPTRKRSSKAPELELGKDWEIHLACSVLTRSGWGRKRASDGGIVDRVVTPRFKTIDKKVETVALLGSTSFDTSAYRLTTRQVGAGELRVQVWRRNVTTRLGTLDPLAVELIGEFSLDGCNGELRRDRVEHLDDLSGKSWHPRSPARRLPAPAGSAASGQGYLLGRGKAGVALTLPGGDTTAHAALLARVESPHARVVFSDAGSATPGGAPFFFQTAQQSFFVHPVGKAVPRRVVQFGRFLHFGPVRRAAQRRGPARRRGARESELEDAETTESEALNDFGVVLEPDAAAAAPTLEPSEHDRANDELDEAWYPEDAEALKLPRFIRRIFQPKRKAAPAAAAPAPAPARRPPPARPRARGIARPVPVRRAPPRVLTAFDHKMRFVSFEHPSSCALLITLKSSGLEGLFEAGTKRLANGAAAFRGHRPTPLVEQPLPSADLDFDLSSPYGLYNWELFFHAPLLVALRLAKEGRHEEAQRWFHFIFDPTVDDSEPSAKRFWRFLPLKLDRDESARKVVATLSQKTLPNTREAHGVQAQLMAWMDKPFSPHVIARLRPAAYQKAVVTKYIDNLLEWGDRLFRQDTMESIQEATQLYILASNIMGPRPERIERIVEPPPATFRSIREQTNLFANWMVRFETDQVRKPFRIALRPSHHAVTQALRLETEYFCVPHNPQLEKYWDTVRDRLHKIRNCMNIQGVVRQLPLFEPPIDPGMLVRAAASGADLGSVLSGLNAPLPVHRCSFWIRQAILLAEELRGFGQAALHVLERRDAEALAMLRATQENKLKRAIRDVKKLHVKEVEEELSELSLRREELDVKIQYLTAQSQEFMNPQERASQAAMSLSKVYTIVTEGIELASKIAYAIPEIQSGGAGISSPFVTLQLGGQMFGSISSAVAATVQKIADKSEVEAELAEAQAEYQRRRAEWQQELDVLAKEKAQLDKQVAGVNLKLEIANKELQRHDLEVESAARMQEFLRQKFTNEELYGWMLSQLASVHFQVYKFAFDAARQAQRTFQFERADATASFIEFAYWDSLKRGLFAGERLLLDLRRLEAAYLEGDRRLLEITRHLSLREDFPLAYDELLGTGRCEFEVTEALLDGDFPGHYCRRIKSVSLSVSTPAKPFQNVNATLTLLSNRLRIDPGAGGNYAPAEDGEDARFSNNPVQIQSVATSRIANDAGVFQLRFDDPRYLPFEGAGAVSKWRLGLSQTENGIPVSRFEDIVISLSYTARDGGAPLESAARAHRMRALAQGSLKPVVQHRVSLRRDLPELFQKLSGLAPGQELESKLALSSAALSARFAAFEVRVERVIAVVHPRGRALLAPDGVRLRIEPPRGSPVTIASFSAAWPNSRALRGTAEAAGGLGDWKLGLSLASALPAANIEDIALLFELRFRA